jgi:hypothetical protein
MSMARLSNGDRGCDDAVKEGRLAAATIRAISDNFR